MIYDNICWKHEIARSALQRTLCCCLALFIAVSLRVEWPYWAAMSAFMLVQSKSTASLSRFFDRIVSIILGSLAAIIVVSWLYNYQIILTLVIVVVTILSLSYNYRHNSYIALLFCTMFLSVTVNVYEHPKPIIDVAFFLCFDFAIGIIAELIVTNLVFPENRIQKIKELEKLAIDQYFDFKQFVCQTCFDKQKQEDLYIEKHNIMLATLEKLAAIRSDAKMEKLIPYGNKDCTFDIEEHLILSKQLIVRYYFDYFSGNHPDYPVKQEDHEKLIRIFNQVKKALSDLTINKILYKQYNDHIEKAYKDFIELKETYEIEKYPMFFLYIETIFPLLQARLDLNNNKQPNIPVKKEQNSITISKFIDLVCIKHATKIAIVVITIPVIWTWWLHLPGLGQIMMSVIMLTKLDIDDTIARAKLRLFGGLVGLLLGVMVLALDISNFYMFMTVFAIITFIIAYFYYSDATMSSLPLQTFFTFLVTAITSLTPTEDLSPGITRVIGIGLGIIVATTISAFIWPSSKKDIFKFQIAQIQENFYKVTSQVKKNFSYLYEKQLYSLYQSVLEIRYFNYNDKEKLPIYNATRGICYALHTIFAILASKQNKISIDLKKDLIIALEILEMLVATNEKIWLHKYCQQIADLDYHQNLLSPNFHRSEYLFKFYIEELLNKTHEFGKLLIQLNDSKNIVIK